MQHSGWTMQLAYYAQLAGLGSCIQYFGLVALALYMQLTLMGMNVPCGGNSIGWLWQVQKAAS